MVRDVFPDRFFDVHLGLFTARHDQGLDLRDESVIGDVLSSAGVDADEVMESVADGGPRQAFRKAHEAAVTNHQVFGVPTFMVGDRAAFVRITTRPGDDAAGARSTIEARSGAVRPAPRAQRVQAHQHQPLSADAANEPKSACERATSSGVP